MGAELAILVRFRASSFYAAGKADHITKLGLLVGLKFRPDCILRHIDDHAGQPAMPASALLVLSDEEASSAFSLAADTAGQTACPEGFHGDGIVIPAGGEVYFPNAWVCIHRLRALGCRLPIQIWHLGAEEINPLWIEWLKELQVTFVDAHALLAEHPHRALTGWPLKVYALLWSPFSRVMLIDADNVPVRDPTFLFSGAEFSSTGAVFWPDLWTMFPDHLIWNLCGIEPRTEREFETGQILVDKQRCWSGLWLTNWMNERADIWYRHVHGDKDTFRMSWHRLGLSWAMPTKRFPDMPERKYIRQYDFDGQLIFQHRCAAKWQRNDRNELLAEFMHERECLRAIDALRARYASMWKDRMGPSFLELCGQTWVCYGGENEVPRQISFQPDGSINDSISGGPADRLCWWSYERFSLIFHDRFFKPMAMLKQVNSESWIAAENISGSPVGLRAVAVPQLPSSSKIGRRDNASPQPRLNPMQNPTSTNPRDAEPLDLITLARAIPGPLTVVDVGCRWGFADRWLELGERVRLFGFDPDRAECARLAERYQDRSHITLVPQALGSFSGPARLHLTKDPGSSSLYPPDPAAFATHPEIRRCLEPVGTTMVELARLEDWARQAGVERIDFLKLDVQGAELDVLMGAGRLLDGVIGIEAEVEFNPMYLGQPLFADVDRYLRAHGFRLWRLGHLVHYGNENERTDLVATQELTCYDSRGFFLPGQGGTLFWGHAYYINDRR